MAANGSENTFTPPTKRWSKLPMSDSTCEQKLRTVPFSLSQFLSSHIHKTVVENVPNGSDFYFVSLFCPDFEKKSAYICHNNLLEQNPRVF
jgi:hypothetical protein